MRKNKEEEIIAGDTNVEEEKKEEDELHNLEFLLGDMFNDRKIILNASVNELSITHAWLQFEYLKKQDKKAPIYFFVNCNGGSTYDVGFLIDYIKSSNTPIVTVGMGCCLSAGFLLLIAGHYRIVFNKTALMIHQTSISSPTMTLPALRNYIETSVKEEDSFIAMMVEQSDLSREDIYTYMANRDWYMTADEAKSFGFIDFIVKPKWRKNNVKKMLDKYPILNLKL